jgi:hypothetical protein
MTLDLEDALREGMQRHTSDVVVPPQLFASAERRYRMRRNGTRVLVLSGVVATGVAVGASVAAGPVSAPARHAASRPPLTTAPLETVGYLRARITAAIDGSDAILHSTHKYGDNPVEDRWTDMRTGRYFETWRQPDEHGHQTVYRVSGQDGTLAGIDTKPRTALLSPTQLRDALIHHKITVIGHERLRGRDTVHVKYQSKSPFGVVYVDTWVDAKSDLPLRIVEQLGGPLPDYMQDYRRADTDFYWLPRTPQNVARTTQTVPEQFKHTHGG